ncbi:unnamed protein product [Cunninghamella echinulata]
MTITHCVEYEALHIVNIVDIAWSTLGAIIAASILYFRIYHRNQQIFDFSGKIPRPKPIESMLFFGVLFNILRCANAAILLTDTARYPIFRAIMFELPWQIGIAALSSYLFGVVHTLSNSSRHLYTTWVGSQLTVDIASLSVLAIPFLTINPVAIIAAHYAEIGNIDSATKWTQAIYILWLIYTFVLGSLVLIAGIRLIRLLKVHLLAQESENNDDTITKIQLGATKVKIIIGIACFCLWAYSIMIALYAFCRHEIMLSPPFTIVITALALFNGPLATTIIEFALVLNVSIINGLGHISFGSSQGSRSQTTTTQQKETRHFSLSTSPSVQSNHNQVNSAGSSSGHHHSSSNKIQLELWSRLDTQQCLKEDEEDEEQRRKSNKQLQNIRGSSSSFTPSSFTQQHQQQQDGSLSKIEEEQRYYNQMTSQLRKPPPSLTMNHSSHVSNDDINRYDGNESVSSCVHLVGP